MNDQRSLLFGINDKPPVGVSLLAGFQHLLAIFGGIVTAPLIIARGMDLPVLDSNYLLTSALLISGIATWIQISRIGPFGSGLLSIQGTSFTFIGPILFAFASLSDELSLEMKLATIFGTATVAAILMMPLCYYIDRLKRIFTTTVTGATVILLGATLVWTTLGNLTREYGVYEQQGEGWLVVTMAGCVFLVTILVARSKNPWVRLSSIMAGLGSGYLLAFALGQLDYSVLNELDKTFTPEPLRYGLAFDWGVLALLLPVFLVTATESVGDFTATSALSKQATSGPQYWSRVRGGLLGDALNSVIAALFATFPNTTFSQNNGVIRLTGIASRHIGYVVAGMLIVMGFFPIVGGVFQIVPAAVVYGSTVLMFGMVALAGVNILQNAGWSSRSLAITLCAIIGGVSLSVAANHIEVFPAQLSMILQFPVSTGAVIAMCLELIIPNPVRSNATA